MQLLLEKDTLLEKAAVALKAQSIQDIPSKVAQLQDELKNAHRELDSLNAKLASSKRDDLMKNTATVGSVKLAVARFDGMQPDVARSLADEIKADCHDTVAVIAITDGARINFITVAGKDAVAAGAHAGKLVGAVAAVTGGKGGNIILDTCKKTLAVEYPAFADLDISLPDESSRRVGQSIAAASLPANVD